MVRALRTEAALREFVGEPAQAVAEKATDHVDAASARFLAASSFFLLAAAGHRGTGGGAAPALRQGVRPFRAVGPAMWPAKGEVPTAGQIVRSQHKLQVPAKVIDKMLRHDAKVNRY